MKFQPIEDPPLESDADNEELNDRLVDYLAKVLSAIDSKDKIKGETALQHAEAVVERIGDLEIKEGAISQINEYRARLDAAVSSEV
ncbi:MAG: hypothetical protein WCT19_01965 [Candidatus Paceibacterota bacterium]|jgi:hypothetical protein